MNFNDLKDVLNAFDDIGWKGTAGFGDWEIANGGYDLWFELSYQDEVVARCVDGEMSFHNRMDANDKKELWGQIKEVYDHLRLEPEEQRKLLEASFEVGLEFFEKETGRFFTLSGEGGRSFNIWNIDVFDSDKDFLHRTSVHAGRLANDILAGAIVSAEGVTWQPVYSKIANDLELTNFDDFDSVPGQGNFPTLAEIKQDYVSLMDVEFIEGVSIEDLTAKRYEDCVAKTVERLVEDGAFSKEQVDRLLASVGRNRDCSDSLENVIKTCENISKDKDKGPAGRDETRGDR